MADIERLVSYVRDFGGGCRAPAGGRHPGTSASADSLLLHLYYFG
jgi:hypothetical protein